MFAIADEDCDNMISARDFHAFWVEVERYLELKDAQVDEQDVLTQFQDMIKFSTYQNFLFSLHDLQSCKMHMNLFDAMFSGQKFILFE